MIISYSLISLLIVIMLGMLFNLSIDILFEQYALNQKRLQIDNIISQVDQQYDESTGIYDVDSLEVIGNAALMNGFFVHIQTANKEIDWDIRQHKAQECLILLQHAEMNMHSRYPNFQGGYAEETYDLKHNDKLAGSLTVGYYGPYSLSDNELLLINQLNRVIVGLGAVFLIIAILSGVFMARRIAAPITGVIQTAQQIAGGKYGIQTADNSAMKEMSRLIAAINEMSCELERNEQQKKQYSADVAHELRTPLNNLQSHMEAMIDKVWNPSTEHLQSCHAEIIRLTQIVAQLQELYMLESKKAHIDMIRFDFSELCDAVFTDFEISANLKNIKLSRQIPSSAPVYGDMNRLKQCLVNLLSNAIRYTPNGKTVTVEYEKISDDIFLRVCDEGTGIPSEDLPYIFERFYRTDKSRSLMTGGMGVGLSITKAIVENHGGKITAESQNSGGMMFTIKLPYMNKINSP